MGRVQLNESGIEELFHDPEGEVARVMERKAYAVENAAKRELLKGGSGRVYTTTFWRDQQGRLRRGRPRPPHQAAAPGEPPASDTGHLLNSIGHEMFDVPSGISARVGTDDEVGLYQEHGTRTVPPHPWLRPALDIGLKS